MKFSFQAKIYKVGINPCVKVPKKITGKLTTFRGGYIAVKGQIDTYSFTQTLVPVKDAPYRLFVNGPMLKGAGLKVGNTAHFVIEQDLNPKTKNVSMPLPFKTKLRENNVLETFRNLVPSRQKEILKYLSYLKTQEARVRNMDKVILALREMNT